MARLEGPSQHLSTAKFLVTTNAFQNRFNKFGVKKEASFKYAMMVVRCFSKSTVTKCSGSRIPGLPSLTFLL